MTTTIEVQQTIPTGTWQLDPVHSSVGFEIPYLVGTFKGQFHDVQAELVVEKGEARLAGAAEVASVDVKDENLAAHLQSPDFFDAERNPQLRFNASGIALDDGAVSVEGELTIKGVTKAVEVTGTVTEPLVDAYGKERIGLVLTTTVNRHDFGVSWNIPLPTGKPAVGDDVTIDAELYFVRAA